MTGTLFTTLFKRGRPQIATIICIINVLTLFCPCVCVQALELLSELGGQAGLWLGVSVVALFEVAELIMDVVIVVGRTTCRRKTDNKAKGGTVNEPFDNDDKQLKLSPYFNVRRRSQKSDTITVDTMVDW